MSEAKDGGPAFPAPAVWPLADGMLSTVASGLTIRDFFAAHIIANTALWCGPDPYGPKDNSTEESFGHAAKLAYQVADAMLSARKGTG